MKGIAAEQVASLMAQGTPDAADELQRLAETADTKDLRKEARRALFRLSQRGVNPTEAVTVQRSSPPVAWKEDGVPALRAFASAFDGAGNRLLFYALFDPDGGRPTLADARISDETGVEEFHASRVSHKELAGWQERFRPLLDSGLAIAEIEADYGCWLLHEARAINTALGSRTPSGFPEYARRIGEPRELYARAAVYSEIDPDALRADLTIPRDPGDFFKLPWFEPWFLDAIDILPYLDRWKQEETSVVIVTDHAKHEMRERVVTDVAESLLAPPARARYVRRLEESADVLRRSGKAEDAKIALVHALALAEDRPVSEVPFARALVVRSFSATLELFLQSEKELQPFAAEGEPTS